MKISQFLRETKAELKHVIWPTRTKTAVYALAVIIISLAVGYFLGGFDTLFQSGLRSILLF